ncbi:MAG: TonB family protein [Acidobacteriota bacterium]|nr:TonB family protein [Acidobacteriota bacterium]
MTLADSRPPTPFVGSVSLERLNARRADGKTIRLALLAAIVFHALIVLVPLPQRNVAPAKEDISDYPEIIRPVIEPPELPERPQVVIAPAERRRPIPVPDLPKDYVEPVHEAVDAPFDPEGVEEFDPVIVAPVAPRPAGPLEEHTVGLVRPVRMPGAPKPDYPEMARRIRLEGKVVLRAVIDTTGRVTSIRVIRAPEVDAGFVEAAKEAVLQWRYEPGLYGGEPVEVIMTVVIDFTLN